MKDYLKKAVMAMLVMTMIVTFFPNEKIQVQAEEKYSGEWRYTIGNAKRIFWDGIFYNYSKFYRWISCNRDRRKTF